VSEEARKAVVFKLLDNVKGRDNACCGAQMFLGSGEGVVFKGAVGPWYCHFRATRFAPSGEEMDEDDPTAKPRKLVLRAVQTRQREQ
jgi:hypothetical protein